MITCNEQNNNKMMENKNDRDGMKRNQQKEEKHFIQQNENKQYEVPHHMNCSKFRPLTRMQASNNRRIVRHTLAKTPDISLMVTSDTDIWAIRSAAESTGSSS